MVLFKYGMAEALLIAEYGIYIPLWSYSNLIIYHVKCSSNIFTFHYGPIQMQLMNISYQANYIYIPLWSYSNAFSKLHYALFKYNLHSTMVLFKFHYISTFPLLIIFTFHYGPIQIVSYFHLKNILLDLHSTMVLFKLNSSIVRAISYSHLHSTMVLFKLLALSLIHEVALFTFHYGPIQIPKATYK